MIGIPTIAKNASAVPLLTPGVMSLTTTPLLTSTSKIAPTTAYNIPATRPTNAIRPACSFARESTPILFDFAITYSACSVSSILCDPDEGGLGVGRTIFADAGAVEIAGPDGLFVNGNVGIGIPSPAEALDVVGNVHVSGSFVAGNTTTYGDGSITLSAGTDLNVDSNTLFVDNANDRVGIGPPGPAEALDVVGNVHVSGSFVAGNTTTYGDGSIVLSSTDLGITGGNVGIGTTGPLAKLHVSGTSADVSGNGGSNIRFGDEVLVKNEIAFFSASDTNNRVFHKVATDNSGNNTTVMTLTGTGRVGVGTTDPATQLHLKGGRLQIEPTISGGNGTLQFTTVGQGSAAQYHFYTHTGNTLRISNAGGADDIVQLDQSGNLTISGQIKIAGGSPGAGKVLTSDGSGLASWSAPGAAGPLTATEVTLVITTSGSDSVFVDCPAGMVAAGGGHSGVETSATHFRSSQPFDSDTWGFTLDGAAGDTIGLHVQCLGN